MVETRSGQGLTIVLGALGILSVAAICTSLFSNQRLLWLTHSILFDSRKRPTVMPKEDEFQTSSRSDENVETSEEAKESNTNHQNTCSCGQPSTLRCSQCKSMYYCSKACQRQHWPAHKASCRKAAPATPRQDLGALFESATNSTRHGRHREAIMTCETVINARGAEAQPILVLQALLLQAQVSHQQSSCSIRPS